MSIIHLWKACSFKLSFIFILCFWYAYKLIGFQRAFLYILSLGNPSFSLVSKIPAILAFSTPYFYTVYFQDEPCAKLSPEKLLIAKEER